jgi:SAM-dependent methyltransferase
MTAETTHLCPPDGDQRTPCCNQTPFDLPRTDRMTLRECVTVVKPGEVLVIRVPDWWGPEQVRVYQEYLDEMTGGEFEVLAVVGEEFAVIAQDAAINEVRTSAGPLDEEIPAPFGPVTGEQPGSGSQKCRCSVVPD